MKVETGAAAASRVPSSAFPETEAPAARSGPRLSGVFPGRVEYILRAPPRLAGTRPWVRCSNGRGDDPGSARPGLDLRSSPGAPAGDASGGFALRSVAAQGGVRQNA